ncbi:hypothetical protein BC830DRAFT_1172400 [Chytriomyces sp. MP71]|nr:hypothetical protein BC830DRAFT_1172400 [Chytriomyces sp. MP71]
MRMPSSSPEAKPGCCGTPPVPITANSETACCGPSLPAGERDAETDSFSRSLVCECAKCTCSQCRCNVPANQRAAASRESLFLRVSLPRFTPVSPALTASATNPAASSSSAAPGILRENLNERVPACVANAALRAKCGSRVRCTFVDVKYALLRGLAADARAVVFVADEYGGDGNLIAITIDVILAPSTGHSLDAISSACSSILSQRGYSISPASPTFSPTLSASRKSGQATPKKKTRNISPEQVASGRSTVITINDALSHESQAPSVKRITAAIVGMTCKSCIRTIISGLQSISGLVEGTLVVDLDASDERILEELDSITWVTHKRIGQATLQLDLAILTAQTEGAAAISDIGSFVRDRIESFGFEVLITFVDDIHGSSLLQSFPSRSYGSDREPLIDHILPEFLVPEGTCIPQLQP